MTQFVIKSFFRDPSLVMTLEYGMFKSEFPKLEFVTPAVFRCFFFQIIFNILLNKNWLF